MDRMKIKAGIAAAALVSAVAGSVFVFVLCVLPVFDICNTEEWREIRSTVMVMAVALWALGTEITVFSELARLRSEVLFLHKIVLKGENHE